MNPLDKRKCTSVTIKCLFWLWGNEHSCAADRFVDLWRPLGEWAAVMQSGCHLEKDGRIIQVVTYKETVFEVWAKKLLLTPQQTGRDRDRE